MSTAPFAAPPMMSPDASEALRLLGQWVARGWLREVDEVFARFLANEAQGASSLLILAAALVSHQLGRGHTCLDLAATLANPAFALSLPPEPEHAKPGAGKDAEGDNSEDGEDGEPLLPSDLLRGVELAHWIAALNHPKLVGHAQAQATTAEPGESASEANTPLVLSGKRLYLRRYWRYEQNVSRVIRARLASRPALDAAFLRLALDRLFAPQASSPSTSSTPRETDWQKLACALAARSAFSIVTGGPGTGKTTTVVRLLALLQAQALAQPNDARLLRIRLAAPTGKAAARLNESIEGSIAKLPLDTFPDAEIIRHSIPRSVTTLHRLLGTVPDSRRFRHHAGRPLPLDVLVIDEASMVDLEMMSAVLTALPPDARIVLLGDKDQLSSVEAGAVLGELCSHAGKVRYTGETRLWLEAATGERIDPSYVDHAGSALDQSIAMLRKSHRFASTSGIGELAAAVNLGRSGDIAPLLAKAHDDIAYADLSVRGDERLRLLAVEGAAPRSADAADTAAHTGRARRGYRHYLEVMHHARPARGAADAAFDEWARVVLRAHGEFQLLCAHRRGPWGVEELNRRIARWLQEASLIDADSPWYAGRPVLVTQNDYELQLMNGDIGIALAGRGKDGEPTLRVAFASGDAGPGIRWVSPSRLRSVETVFALTVHKSQGSEFTHAAMVLPDKISPVITRELVYTGITRARQFLTIASADGMELIERAVQTRVQRSSGLSEACAAP